jgi:hypothetical protein
LTLLENIDLMSCVLVYYDLLDSVLQYPSFYMLGDRVYKKDKSVITLLNLDTISTYLFCKIYLLNFSGYEPPVPNL